MIRGDQLVDVAFRERELIPEFLQVIPGNRRGRSFGYFSLLAGERRKKGLAPLLHFVGRDRGKSLRRQVVLSRAQQVDGFAVRTGWILRPRGSAVTQQHAG